MEEVARRDLMDSSDDERSYINNHSKATKVINSATIQGTFFGGGGGVIRCG